MSKKKVVVALGHKALGATLPQQQDAVKGAAKAIADLVEADCQVIISHSNAPQVGMIHTAMNEFGKQHPDYTFAPISVCSAMRQAGPPPGEGSFITGWEGTVVFLWR